jgi:hypothetical protein
MKSSEIKSLLINSLKADTDPAHFSAQLEEAGISYDFRDGFRDKILDSLFSAGSSVNREVEFIRSMNFAFYRIALTGVAAIVVLLISIFLMEGSLSLNSLLGVSDNYNESIVSLLTGN